MKPTPRQYALAILTEMEATFARGGSTLDEHMDRFHRESRLDRRDEAFVTALVYGVLRWRMRLDGIISSVSTTPIAKMDPRVLTILRIGLYQILFMNRVPQSAAVNTSVELANSLQKKWLSGFVNAVLRNVLRDRPKTKDNTTDEDPVTRLARAQSMPAWLVKRWIDQLGFEEATTLCECCNAIPPLVLRTNTPKVDRTTLMKALGDHAETIAPTRFSPEGIILDRLREPLFRSRAFEKGWFQIQDEAAQAVSHLLAPLPGQRVLDACAGLGGKTAHIAALMGNSGHVTATDRDARKLHRLDEEMRRLGIEIVSAQRKDLQGKQVPEQLGGPFDRILLDAPCSGLGVIRRNPDTKWSRTLGDIDRCASKQHLLLANLADHLKPEGILVYAVCSTEPEETLAVVDSFLKNRPDFAIDEAPPEWPSSLMPLLDHSGCMKTAPHLHGTDGFFAVRLRHC